MPSAAKRDCEELRVPGSEGLSSLAANLQAPRAPELGSRKLEIQLRSRQDRPERVAGRPPGGEEGHQKPGTPIWFQARKPEWKTPPSNQPPFGSLPFPPGPIIAPRHVPVP